jgi:hypothetical protein
MALEHSTPLPPPIWADRMAQWLAAQACQDQPPPETEQMKPDQPEILAPGAWPRVLPGL